MVKSGARHEEFACVARLSIITKGRSARPDGGYSLHQKGVGPVAHKGGESHIDLAAGARLDDLDLQPNGARCKSHIDVPNSYEHSGCRFLALLDRVVTQKGMDAAYPIDHLGYAQVHN